MTLTSNVGVSVCAKSNLQPYLTPFTVKPNSLAAERRLEVSSL